MSPVPSTPPDPDPHLPTDGPVTLGEALAAAARLIPSGRAASYGALAGLLGRGGPRQAGRAMAESEPGTPWWRVVRADGSLPEPLRRQARERWAAEGTPVRGSGTVRDQRVDLAQAGWEPDAAARAALADLAARVG
ncbi:MGMT family protein [Micrococcus porci]|uniref:MGMT family protein n=1 Tax=Micrococcus TaxID=1269 RepID=UPI001CCE27CA|nr:MGMT family protein [Micrococcus porci]MCG7422545.1 MGMT family protein [Micrococcus sp. ACRRV]UBH23571.1 MGMT family protein [Micrococcus porci]